MNLREGSIGALELRNTLAIALIASGLFAMSPYALYAQGNLSYATIPASMLVALIVAFVASLAIRRGCEQSLFDMTKESIGAFAAVVLCVSIVLGLVISAIAPLIQFLRILQHYIFTADYFTIGVFIAIAICFIGVLGFECIGRTANVMATVLLLTLVFILAVPLGSYDVYRMLPAVESSADFAVLQATEALPLFLALLLLPLCMPKAVHGVKYARRPIVCAGAIAIVATFVALLCIALVFPYEVLRGEYAPLFRLNTLVEAEGSFVRVEKITVFLLLAGCIIGCAYAVYGSSRLVAQLTSQRDTRPGALCIGMASVAAACAICLYEGRIDGLMECLSTAKRILGGVMAALVIVASVVSTIKHAARGEKQVCGE
ncbi:MAG: GerAB/ArcD/ProY family transporter [Clostridia bacterium]|nr:GerAB/ArcD/ProY family transporter [Clostridia bacterium]